MQITIFLLGGFGFPIFAEKAYLDYEASLEITAPLVAIMVLKGDSLLDDIEVNRIKTYVMNHREEAILSKSDEIKKMFRTEDIKSCPTSIRNRSI